MVPRGHKTIFLIDQLWPFLRSANIQKTRKKVLVQPNIVISFKWSFFPVPIFFRLSYLKVHINNNSKIPPLLVLANSKYGVPMLLVNCLQFQVEWTSYIRNVFSLAFLSLLWWISCRWWLLDWPRSSLFSSQTWYLSKNYTSGFLGLM